MNIIQFLSKCKRRLLMLIKTKPKSITGLWIDVGAHLGETTISIAAANPLLTVYAFEANSELAARITGRYSNYHVTAKAIAETDGWIDFTINGHDGTSSILPIDLQGLARWIDGESILPGATAQVPCIRLDTFLNENGIASVDYLKVDAQGYDLNCVKSLGQRISDVKRIKLEVIITPIPLYTGECTEAEVLDFMTKSGFTLTGKDIHVLGQFQDMIFDRAA